MTRLLIIADMEGISGLDRYEQCHSGHHEYPEGVKLLTDELNVIGEKAFASGAQSVSVMDWHGGGGNVDRKRIDERIEVVPEDLSPGFDLAFLIGFHAMAGDVRGFISHTMRQGLAVEVGGVQIGELSLLSWWLGEHGVPVGLVSGDRAATSEVELLLGDIPCHTVKRAESWSRAISVPLEQSYEALRSRVSRVIGQPGRWETVRPTLPHTFRLKLRDQNPAPSLLPWLTSDDEGWLNGKVEKTRDLIDLIDVVSALINLNNQYQLIDALRADSGIADRLDTILQERIKQNISTGHWTP